jgi:hypothetical protein
MNARDEAHKQAVSTHQPQTLPVAVHRLSWSEIGARFGISKQAAHRRFPDRPSLLVPVPDLEVSLRPRLMACLTAAGAATRHDGPPRSAATARRSCRRSGGPMATSPLCGIRGTWSRPLVHSSGAASAPRA